MEHRGWPMLLPHILVVVVVVVVVVVEAASASSPAAFSPVKPPGANHEALAGGALQRERRGNSGVLVKDLMRLAEGEHPNSTVAEANQRLWESSEKGRCDEIWLQIQAGAEVNARGPGGWTALHYAARYGHTDAICRLVELGALVDARTRVQFTPLHHAAMRGHTKAAMRLVTVGADIFAQTLDGLTPLDWAARNGHIPCLTALHDAAQGCAPLQRPGSIAYFSKDGQISRLEQTLPDTTGRELRNPWTRFGEFEWCKAGPKHL